MLPQGRGSNLKLCLLIGKDQSIFNIRLHIFQPNYLVKAFCI
ncbi:hypothetical protein pb186bvf_015598 [Paramecium bursaria]